MKRIVLSCLLSALVLPAAAKDKILPLSDAHATSLQGKTLVISRHGKPGFTAMTAGKAAFGIFGAAAMIEEGKQIINDNGVADPADVLEAQLPAAIARQYGMRLIEEPGRQLSAVKPRDIAAAMPPGIDYVLDIGSLAWMSAYYPTDWNSYWVMYIARVQLIDVSSGAALSHFQCNVNSKKNSRSPSRAELLADGAGVLKAITTSLGWQCAQRAARDQFRLPEGGIAATPAEYLDPMAVAAAAATVATPAHATAAATPAMTDPSEGEAADAAASQAANAETGDAEDLDDDAEAPSPPEPVSN